jgi:hypothetical protein
MVMTKYYYEFEAMSSTEEAPEGVHVAVMLAGSVDCGIYVVNGRT